MRAVLPESQPARPDTLAPALPTRAKKMLLARWLSGFSYYASAILTFFGFHRFSSSSGIEKLVFHQDAYRKMFMIRTSIPRVISVNSRH